MGLAAQGGARRSTCQGRAGDQKTRDRSVQQTGANRGGAKELKGASGGRVEELSGFHRRGEREARWDHHKGDGPATQEI